MPQLEGDQQYTEEAILCADMMALLNDLHHSNRAATIFLSGKYAGDGENQTIRKSLYESALITFRRIHADGKSRIATKGRPSWKFPKIELDKLIGDKREEFDEVMRLANRCVAHRVSSEAGLAEVVKNAPQGQPFVQIKYTEKNQSIIFLLQLTKKMIDYLAPLVIENCNKAKESNSNDS